MFDVGFWELTFLATLALLVLGPDKLPGVVSGVGRMLGRARSLARGLKMQMEREFNDINQTASQAFDPTTPAKSASKADAAKAPDGEEVPREEGAAEPVTEAPAADSIPDEERPVR